MNARTDFHTLTVADVKRETADAVAVTFAVPADLADTFRFEAGQHLVLKLNLDGAEQRRNYSISTGGRHRHLRIGIKRVAGGLVSGWAQTGLKPGDQVAVMPPQGRFMLPKDEGEARHFLMIAAGAGITPIVAMVREALELRPQSRVTLLYGNRTAAQSMFLAEIEDLKDAHVGRFRFLPVFSDRDETDTDLLQGRIDGEKIKALAGRMIDLSSVDHAFVCGPGTMIREARDALQTLGLPRERFHHEFFAAGGGGARPSHTSAAKPAPVTGSAGQEVVAILDGARHRFVIQPDEHVLQAALRAGVKAPYSCTGGMCCTCRARVVEGSAAMTVNYSLEPWEIEKGFVLTCQAKPTAGRLVVDYDAM